MAAVDNGECSSSEDEPIIEDSQLIHNACVEFDMDSEAAAKIVCRTINVDKEPSRSNARRFITTNGSKLMIKVESSDRRSLQKSLANLFDMCELSRATISLVEKKSWITQQEPKIKKAKMFKGLKSKLEDEAKKLQASVQQYGEQISHQVEQLRQPASDAGSESGSSVTRRFTGTSPSRPSEDTLNYSVGNALMEEVAEGDLLGLEFNRERRLSGGSTHSVESSLSTFFQSVPGITSGTLDAGESDVESVLDDQSSGLVRSATKEQISSVLSKLQGRAANYKDKYRDLVKKYNEVVTENNKCRTVLAQTQDKALNRIEKLRNEKKVLGERLKEVSESNSQPDMQVESKLKKYEEMLEKCKDEITKNRTKIKELSLENETLKEDNNKEGQSDVTEKVTAEWKTRIDKVEEEWTERINKSDTDHAIQLATAKAEMHAALENKDREIESLRLKCKELEVQDGAANERWQKRVDELLKVVQALETEKTDMVEKLSMAKQQGVQAVQEEEEQKKKEMIEEFRKKEDDWSLQLTAKETETKEKLKELEEKLRMEFEQVSQKVADNEENSSEKQILENEISRLKEALSELSATSEKKVRELEESLETTKRKHGDETIELIHERDEILEATKKQQQIERESTLSKLEHVQAEADQLRLKAYDLERQLLQTHTEASETDEVESQLRVQLEDAKLELLETSKRLRDENEKTMEELNKRLNETTSALEDAQRSLNQLEDQKMARDEISASNVNQLELEVKELRAMIAERDETVHRIEKERDQLQTELLSAKELAAMQEHLREELEDAQRQRESVEAKVLLLTESAESAEKSLQEDRAKLKQEREEFEKTIQEYNESKPSSEEVEHKVVLNDQESALVDVSNDDGMELSASDMSSRLDDLERRNEKLAQQLVELEEERNSLTEKLSTITSSSEALSEDRDRLMDELSETSSSLKETESARFALIERLEKLECETRSTLEDFSTEKVQAENELRETLEKLNERNESLQVIEKESEALKLKLGEAESALSSSTKDREAAETELKNLQVTIDQLNSQLSDIVLENETSVKKLQEELAQAVKDATADKELATKLQTELDQTKEIVAKTELSIQKSATGESELSAALAKISQEKEELIAKLSSLQEMCDFSELKIKELEEKRERQEAERTEKNKQEDERRNAELKELEEAFSNEKARVDSLEADYKSQLEKSEQELAAARALTEQRNNSEQAQTTSKIEELQRLNEKMRVEFLAKEKILSDLRAEIEEGRNVLSAERKEWERKEEQFNIALDTARSEFEKISKELEDAVALSKDYEQKIKSAVEQRERGKQEESAIRKSIRQGGVEPESVDVRAEDVTTGPPRSAAVFTKDQYSLALENQKLELAETMEKVLTLEKAQIEAEKVKSELSAVKTEFELYKTTQQQESEAAMADLRQKAEKKMKALKANSEKDVASVKAEILLQVNELRSQLSEKERKMDEILVEKARVDQRLIGLEDLEKELEESRQREKKLTTKSNSMERHGMELEADQKLHEEKRAEWTKEREKLLADIEIRDEKLKELEAKLSSLEQASEEGFRKAAAKQDSDSKKVVRELQREVKQLYVELNEKTEELHALKKETDVGQVAKSDEVQKKIISVDASPNTNNVMHEEELASMRQRLNEAHREVDSMRDQVTALERKLQLAAKQKASEPATISTNGGHQNHDAFADSAEAEYLRNVLYRYMSERENLGKESVTLARVIGTVVKFDNAKLDHVINAEESRVASWLGGTVSQVNNALGR